MQAYINKAYHPLSIHPAGKICYPPSPMSQLRWLYLDLNSFFASVEQQLRPELRGKPVAVLPAMTDATCAIAASYEAKAFGVKTGTKIWEAKQKCRDLICVPATHELYVRYHHRVLEAIERHLPITHVESIDEVSCRLDQAQSSPQAAIALAKHIKNTIADEVGACIRSSVGIGPNRFLAKTASNLEKPDGLQLLYSEDVPARLLHLEPGDLVGIGYGMQQRLARAGIFTIEQLYTLSPKHMRTLWGSVQGERFWYLLRGVELETLPTKRSTVGHSHVLEPGWRETRRAREVMRRLLLKAASRLRRLGYYATQMSLSLRIEHGPRIGETACFYRSCDNMNLQREAFALWDALMDKHQPQRLKKVSVTLHGLIHADALQPELFAERTQRYRRLEKASLAMDELNNRFGRDTITMGSLPRKVRCFSGTKIAFTRIPLAEEFYE